MTVESSYPPRGNNTTSSRSNLLKTALKTADRGIPVFPLKGKEPLTAHGFKDATTDRSRLHLWWNRYPDANVGIPTGGVSSLVVVDRDGDSPEAGRIWDSLPPTLEVATSRGRHRYYRIPKGTKVRGRKLAADVDLKADGGYVVAAGSVHPSGACYSFVEETRALGIATLPDELLEPETQHKAPRPRPARRGDVDDGGPIHEGARNRSLFFVALALKDAGRSREDALRGLLDANSARCSPPLPEPEVETIVKSAFRYPVRGKKTPPEVMETLASLKRAWWATAWRGVGGKTERDIMRILIQWAERYGHLIPAGVRVSISWRDLAIASGCSHRTIARVVKRLRFRGWLRGDNADRSGTNSGAFVLMPRLSGTTQSIGGDREKEDVESGATLSRLPEVTPCFRWRGFVGKGMAGVLYALEVFGPQTYEELAERLGFSRPRDLRRKYLGGKHRGKKDPPGLIDLGLVEDRRGVFALPGEERYVRRVEDIRAARYGGGLRKVRHKDQQGRMVSRVVEVPPKSEVERKEGDRLKYEAQRNKYRTGGVRAEPVPERTTAELQRVPDPDPGLVDALRRFLRRNPRRRDENPGWFAVALWSDGYAQTKPTPDAVELALAELDEVAA